MRKEDGMLKIQTERLELHKISKHDKVRFFELLSNSELLSYVCNSLSQEEIELQFQSRLQPWNLDSPHWLTLSVFEKLSGSFIGINGFKHHKGNASVGFIFLHPYHGLGYATESLSAVCEYAQSLGIKELSANVTKGNTASECVVKKCGFAFVREIPAAVQIGDKLYNDVEYKKMLNQNSNSR